MSETQTKLGNALLRSLVQLKEKKGHLNIDDVGELFESMAASLTPGSSVDSYVRNEIEKMARHISQAMNEISSISIEKVDADQAEHPTQNLCIASEELNAVVTATEQATHTILDATDFIQSKIGEVGTNKAAIDAVLDATNKIYHACNFQDITGQRIAKVLGTLEFIYARIENLKKLFDEDGDRAASITPINRDTRADAKLMRGPQIAAPSQEDIDTLFANLK